MGSASKRYHDESWLRREYVDKNRSLRDIAGECGVTYGAVMRFVKKYGLESQPRGQWFECEHCGEGFYRYPSQIKGGETKHCSLECRRENNQVKKTCPNCGKEFRAYPSDVELGRGKYCSVECRNEYSKITVQCHHCGQKTERYKHYLKKVERTFCSQECYSEWSKTRTGEDSPAWNGGNRYRGRNWHRMRRKTREKYNGKCAICGVEETEYGSRPDVHHIIPARKFDCPEDANTEDNLILVCRKHHTMLERWGVVPPGLV